MDRVVKILISVILALALAGTLAISCAVSSHAAHDNAGYVAENAAIAESAAEASQ